MTEAMLGLTVILATVLAFTAQRREWKWQRRASEAQAELERIRREQIAAACSEDYLTARIGDLSEGTLSEEHARDIARWVRSWA